MIKFEGGTDFDLQVLDEVKKGEQGTNEGANTEGTNQGNAIGQPENKPTSMWVAL